MYIIYMIYGNYEIHYVLLTYLQNITTIYSKTKIGMNLVHFQFTIWPRLFWWAIIARALLFFYSLTLLYSLSPTWNIKYVQEFVLKSSIQQTEKPRWKKEKEHFSYYICLLFPSCIVLKLLLVWRKQKKSNTKRTPTPVIPGGERCDEKSRTKPASFLLCLLVSIISKFICARAVVEWSSQSVKLS